MIVMGGYVHSRLRELIFGGITQSLLKSSPVPLTRPASGASSYEYGRRRKR